MSTEQFIQLLAPAKGERILDIGAGKGEVANRVLQASNGAEVSAVEPNEKKVVSMKRTFPAIKSYVAGAESLPFPDSYFDKAYATVAFHHFADMDKAFHEVARVLKQGGSFFILEVEPSSGQGRMFRFFGRLMGEHMTIMTQDQLLDRAKALQGLQVAASTKMGPRYLIQLRKL